MDKEGLDKNDRNILFTIIEKYGGGPVGLDTLAASLGEDAGTLEYTNPILFLTVLLTGHPEAVWLRNTAIIILELDLHKIKIL